MPFGFEGVEKQLVNFTVLEEHSPSIASPIPLPAHSLNGTTTLGHLLRKRCPNTPPTQLSMLVHHNLKPPKPLTGH